ncbi:MAG: hypothetical protein M0C28_19240 [Candidatus Moduliflexus flocculans]|nr:hypothetical protein [Candidatus Moduliflexus flocculans]
MRHYGHIQFTVENLEILPAYYAIKRRKGSGAFIILRTITPSELQNNRFQMQDKYLEQGTTYAYRVEAFNSSGQLIGISFGKDNMKNQDKMKQAERGNL